VTPTGGETVGRIGPNAIVQLTAALRDREGEAVLRDVLGRAGLAEPALEAAAGLIPVAQVRALHAALPEVVGTETARSLVAEAGRRTAAYLLAHRIPGFFQRLLARLPTRLRRSLLLAAIARHAWTFTGGSRFTARLGPRARLRIDPCSLCPEAGKVGLGCVYYAATFEALLQRLVDPRTRVEPATCGAAGSRRCELRIARLST
jgi:divinyl protochlorophyllide a 8-vinyl-reductase